MGPDVLEAGRLGDLAQLGHCDLAPADVDPAQQHRVPRHGPIEPRPDRGLCQDVKIIKILLVRQKDGTNFPYRDGSPKPRM
ncbi:hypothetical protein GCM10028864_19680 [Microlunatus parietis]